MTVSNTQTKNKVQTPSKGRNVQVMKAGTDTEIRGAPMEGWGGKVFETTRITLKKIHELKTAMMSSYKFHVNGSVHHNLFF